MSSKASPGALAVGLAVVVAFSLSAWAWRFLCDDAFITFRYAERLAQLGEATFNPGERVEGYTNPAWMFALAVAALLGIGPTSAATALCVSASAIGLGLCCACVHALRQRFGLGPTRVQASDVVPAAWLAVQPEYAVWSGGGLETAAATAAIGAAILTWVRGRWSAAGLCAALAILLRPDTAVPIASFGLCWLAVVGGAAWRERGRAVLGEIPRARLLRAAACFAIPLIVHLLWRRAYYGAWLPNTWTIKAHGALLRESWGVPYVRAWFEAIDPILLLPLVAFVRGRHLVLVGPIAATLAYAAAVGGDFMAYGRFLVPATWCLAVAMGWLLAEAQAWGSARWPRARWWPLLVVGVGLAVTTVAAVRARQRWQHDRERGERWIDGRWEGVTAMDRFARVGWAAGRWMHAHLPPDTLVSVGAAGAVPYGSMLPTLDAYGLVDPYVAHDPAVLPRADEHARPGHQLWASATYLAARDPDLACHVGYRGPTPAGPRHVQRGYARGYTWACIELGTIDTAGGPIDAGFYCCRRPTDRLVEAFAEEHR